MAQAQNTGNGLGNSLLYPLTSLPFQLLNGRGQGFNLGYGSSGFSPRNLIQQAASSPYGYIPYGGRFGLGGSNSATQSYATNYPYGQNGQSNFNLQAPPQPYNYDPNAYQQGQPIFRNPKTKTNKPTNLKQLSKTPTVEWID